jgi:hypothetical protein
MALTPRKIKYKLLPSAIFIELTLTIQARKLLLPKAIDILFLIVFICVIGVIRGFLIYNINISRQAMQSTLSSKSTFFITTKR